MSPDCYNEIKDWLKIGLPLIGHIIAYRIFYINNKRSDERQLSEWKFKKQTDSDRFYLGKLEALHNEIIDLSYSFHDSFRLWMKHWQNGNDTLESIENAREQISKKCKLASAIVTIYFRKDFDRQLAELYLISTAIFAKMSSVTEESRGQVRLNLETIVEDKKKFSEHVDNLLQKIQSKINQITSRDDVSP